MDGRFTTKLSLCALAFAITSSASSQPQSAATAVSLTPEPQHDFIVVLNDQLESAPPVRRAMTSRSAAIAGAQTSVLARLQQMGPHPVRSFTTINAFATKLSPSEAEQLAQHPDVKAIVPDRVIRTPGKRTSLSSTSGAITAPQSTNTAFASSASAAASGLCGTLEPQGLQLINAAFLDPTLPQAQEVIDGNGAKVTGKGVKVAYIADGLDPRAAGFTHRDGSSVFFDFQDFTGDPAGTATGGGEAFGDASSIAANDNPNGKPLLFDISKFVVAAVAPLPSPCNIQVRGVAPDASLAGLNVFSSIGTTTTSNFVQAIEWAVAHDDVDVINESFGGGPLPDNANDPISLANAAAVKAGVTVVVSTGDAGGSTLQSPSSDPEVIASGATTQYRLYAQTGDGIFALSKGGLVNNNITPFSSSGFSLLNGRTVDIVAPGDSGWALCSTNVTAFTECTDFNGAASPIEVFGGTSESSPLTAGEAALVIQAYRSAHHGESPRPALVKQIIMSSATDLGAPASQQGAGLINALAAVNTALSVDDANGHPQARNAGALLAPTSLQVSAQPGAPQAHSFTVTNTGIARLRATPALEILGAPVAGANISLQLDAAKLPTFPNVVGHPEAFAKQTFRVPAGVDHLDAAIAFQTVVPNPAVPGPVVLLGLLDPAGNQVSDSLPQGLNSGYGHVDVVHPAAGTWTAVIWTPAPPSAVSYSGPIQFSWSAEKYEKLGSVSPARIDLAPGESQTLTADFVMPATPGDAAAGLKLLTTDSTALAQIPVSLRTLIPLGATGGSFTGTLTGGNGRQGSGPTQTYAFDVPAGVRNLGLSLQIADNGNPLEGLLVAPDGSQLSVAANQDPSGNLQNGLQLFREFPQAGRWHFVLLQNFFTSGNQTSLPFTARIALNAARITATGLPDSPSVQLPAGKPVSVSVEVVNTGSVTSEFFADARLAKNVTQTLQLQNDPKTNGCQLPPLTLPGACGAFVVPPQTSGVQFKANSIVPINMDVANQVGTGVGLTGSPDVFAKQTSPGNLVATLSAAEVPYGIYFATPSEVGPYGSAGAFTEPVTLSASATLRAFDGAITSDTGDVWKNLTLGSGTFTPLVLGSNQKGVINLTITPDSADIGKTVTGFLYIDTFNPSLGTGTPFGVGEGVGTGDEVVRLPYSYTVTQ